MMVRRLPELWMRRTMIAMGNGIELETLDVLRFARSIERDCQEGVKWEQRKLEWILEEERKRNNQQENKAA